MKSSVELFACQFAEKVINRALFYLFPKGGVHTVETLAASAKHEKKTLGMVITELRKHVDFADPLADLLSDFLDNRNALAHEIERIPGNNFNTEEGRASIIAFADKPVYQSSRLLPVFCGFIESWVRQAGLQAHMVAEHSEFYESEFFQHIEKEILPNVRSLMRAKADP